MLARIRDLNRLELAGETVRAALEALAAAAPGWLAGLPAVQALRRIWIQQYYGDISKHGEMSRTGRGRGRAQAEIAAVRVLEKRLGALPVVAQFGRRLRIAEVVDELSSPVREVAPVRHGEVIEALVANRLTAPAPLVQVEAQSAAMAVDEAYRIEPHLLNDNRLGRALDAIAPHLDEIIGSAGRRRSASSGWTWPGCTGT